MNMKLAIGVISVIVWISAIVLKHFLPDTGADFGQLITMCIGTLSGLGVYHLSSTPDQIDPPLTQEEKDALTDIRKEK